MNPDRPKAEPVIGDLLHTEVARRIQRALKGVQYFAKPDPAVAQTPHFSSNW
jgi:hypothetical protein